MSILNYIRKKFHPIHFLYKYNFFKKLFRFKFIYLNKTTKFGNFYIYLPFSINFLLNSSNYEKETFDFIEKISQNQNITNQCFLDIGANVGIYSLFFRKKYDSKIFLFEPDILNIIALHKTKYLNNLNNFHIFPFALSKYNEITNFLVDEITGLTGTLSLKRNEPQKRMSLTKKKEIISIKLDQFINLIPKTSWVKIDVEGHEFEVIQGMLEIINRDRPKLIIESDKDNINKIQNLLSNLNYQVTKIKEDMNYIFF